MLDSWDASQEVKQIVLECRKHKTDTLNLNNKGLSSFPSALLQHLPYVRNLDLSNNELTFFKLEGASQLQILEISDNHLESFSLQGASHLEGLYLNSNVLNHPPELIDCAKPEILDVSENPYLTTSSGVDKNIIQQRLSLFTVMLHNSSLQI